MLELRTLGTLSLRDARGLEIGSVLKQPKRLALLAYLAIEGRDRWVRRDVLLSLFWPELDQSHARAALRRALFFLRQALGEYNLEGRGDEELRVLPGSLKCDAIEFELALDGKLIESALGLYQGPLLEGFYIAGAPEAEAWLDRTRARLQQRAIRATWAMAENPATPEAQSADWARRAAALTPDDEDSVRRLMNHLQRLGDRSGALSVFEEFARRLRLDDASTPSTDLQSLAIAIKHRIEPPRLDGITTFVIQPFSVHGDASLEYLREGLVNLLTAALDGVADLRVGDSKNPGNLALRGSLVASAGRLRLNAALEDSSGQILSRADAEGSGEESVFQLVDQIARQLLAARPGGADRRLANLAGRSTTSLPALRAWLEGEQHFRQGQFLPALDAYQRSAGLDPGFALAHYRLASAAAASAMIGPARAASRQATSRAAALSQRERLLIEAQDAWLHGAADDAERRYAAVVASYPDDFEAWFLLGDLLFHGNPYRGRSISESKAPLERALSLDPNHLSTLIKLARLAALARDWPRLDQLVNRLVALTPDSDQALGVQAIRFTAIDRTDEFTQVLARLRNAPAMAIAVAFSDLLLYGKDLGEAGRVGQELIQLFRSPELQAFGHLVLAHIAVSRGDLDLARKELSLGRQLDAGWGLEITGLLAALPFIEWNAEFVSETRTELVRWDPHTQKPNVGLPLAFHNGLHPHIRAYLIGLLSARLKDESGVIEAEETLAELEVPEEGMVLVERLERSVRAELLNLRGRHEEALVELAEAPTDIWFQYAVASPFYGGAFERWRRSTLLRQLGRTAEADGWLASIAQRSPWELPFRRAT